MYNQKTSPIGKGEEMWTLGELIYRNDHTVESVANGLGINQLIVMDWVCGIVPPSKKSVELAKLLGCSLTDVCTAILNTPKIV